MAKLTKREAISFIKKNKKYIENANDNQLVLQKWNENKTILMQYTYGYIKKIAEGISNE